MIIRLAKTSLVASVALFLTVVVFNNLTGYNSNFEFVKHVLSMDTTFPDNRGMWRAMTSPLIHHIFYLIIIAWEATTAILCWLGTARCLMASKTSGFEFNRSKHIAIFGLTLSLLLLVVAFIIVGGEWFLMWQSAVWNDQNSAFRMFGIIGIILIFLSLPDGDTDNR